MDAMPLLPYTLPTRTWATGSVFNVPLDQIPKSSYGLINHVARIIYHMPFVPTYSSGTGSVIGNNNIVTRANLNDGTWTRFLGGFNELRIAERMQLGRTALPETDTNTASATLRDLRRVMHIGPANYIDSPRDFLLPAGALEAATIDGQFGTLLQVDANCTAITNGNMRSVVWLYGLENKIHIPPAYEVKTWNAQGGDIQLAGRAAYDFVCLFKSTLANFAAGEVGNVKIDLGRSALFGNDCNAVDLGNGFMMDKFVGDLGTFKGEPGGAADLSVKNVNRATPTAFTSDENNIQPVMWSPHDCQISKLFVSESQTRLQWSGSVGSLTVMTGRFLPQGKTQVGTLGAKALSPFEGKSIVDMSLRSETGSAMKTSPMGEFLPWTLSLK